MSSNVIIDSGGTKSDWAVVRQGEVEMFSTMGLLPQNINNVTLPTELLETLAGIQNVFFYGSGIMDEQSKSTVTAFLFKHTKASHIEVKSDMVGAARSVCGNEKGRVAILGTGSNSCYFDGSKIHTTVPALGYIIGDEGSGASIGKRVLKAYFYNKLSPAARAEYKSCYPTSRAQMLQELRETVHPSAYLAQFASLPNTCQDEYLIQQVKEELTNFIETKILSQEQYSDVPVHFIGSIAYFYAHLIKIICQEQSIPLGQIVKKPIQGLIKYHNE